LFEIISEITSGKETPNFIIPSDVANSKSSVDLNNPPDNAPFIIPNDSEDASLAQTPPSNPNVIVIGRPEPIVLDIAPRTATGPRSTRNTTSSNIPTTPPPPKKPNKVVLAITDAFNTYKNRNNSSSTSFKPNDNIYQTVVDSSNVIGKVPNLKSDNNTPVYYRTSEFDNGKVTSVSDPIQLSKNNPLPTNGKAYILEFGTLDKKQSFAKGKQNHRWYSTLAINP
jgi:hypothetical protein